MNLKKTGLQKHRDIGLVQELLALDHRLLKVLNSVCKTKQIRNNIIVSPVMNSVAK